MNKLNLKSVLLGSGAAVALLASPAVAGEVDDLKAQIEALQQRLDTVEVQQTKIVDTQERVAPANAVTGGDFPGSWKLPGSDTSISFSGYVKADFIYDFDNLTNSDSFGVSGIALDNSASARRDGRTRLHARQSRFRFDSRTPTDWGMMRTRIEGDFFGNGGNQNVSNSNSFRLRHAFGQLGPVLAGQTWTTFMDANTFVDTVDFFGTTGAEFVRQAQIRYTASLAEGLTMDVAVENPQSRILFANATGAAASTNTNDQLPDLVAAFRYTDSWGAINLTGVGRRFEFDVGNGGNDSTWGYGVHIGGNVNLTDNDNIGIVYNFGDGIGRYMLGSLFRGAVARCTNPAANITPGTAGCNVDVETIWSQGGFVRLTHNWTDNLRSSLHGGWALNDVPVGALTTPGIGGSAAANGLNTELYDVRGNIMWSPVSRVNIGFEVMHGWRTTHQANQTNEAGEATRVQLGMQYTF
ncbi:MAG: DcaP family trimeric outer membrane transporter [Proteobacteria bacterium]|nr:DcaP family trimeric outer membrane transporter [Pseudomonadota bacterium]